MFRSGSLSPLISPVTGSAVWPLSASRSLVSGTGSSVASSYSCWSDVPSASVRERDQVSLWL